MQTQEGACPRYGVGCSSDDQHVVSMVGSGPSAGLGAGDAEPHLPMLHCCSAPTSGYLGSKCHGSGEHCPPVLEEQASVRSFSLKNALSWRQRCLEVERPETKQKSSSQQVNSEMHCGEQRDVHGQALEPCSASTKGHGGSPTRLGCVTGL